MRLRGHHLICLHFFSGEGYDSAFIENLENVLKQAESEDVIVCGATDDVCEKCPSRKGHKCAYNESADEDIKEMDTMALNLLGMEKGSMVKWEETKRKIRGIFPPWYRAWCTECDWKPVCEKNKFYKVVASPFNS